jgi:hypothetical protein
MMNRSRKGLGGIMRTMNMWGGLTTQSAGSK